MLTQQVEGATVKCGHYWTDGVYGAYRLKLIEQVGFEEGKDVLSEKPGPPKDGFNFGFFPSSDASTSTTITTANTHNSTIRRTFELTHTHFPSQPPRIVTQLQYLAWPDMDVPHDPSGVLQLVKEVDSVVASARPAAVDELGAAGARVPVLLHCSAGVGRTGGFIVVDAVLDGLRRDLRRSKRKEKKFESSRSGSASVSGATGMDVDGTTAVSSPESGVVDIGSGNSSKEDVRMGSGVSPTLDDAAPILAWSRDTTTAVANRGSVSPPDIPLVTPEDVQIMDVDEVQAQLAAEERGRVRVQAWQRQRDLDLEQEEKWFKPLSKVKAKVNGMGITIGKVTSSSDESDEDDGEVSRVSMSPPASSPPPRPRSSASSASLSVGKPMASLSFTQSPADQIKQKFAKSLVMPPAPNFSSSDSSSGSGLRGRSALSLTLGPSLMPRDVPPSRLAAKGFTSSSDPQPIHKSVSSKVHQQQHPHVRSSVSSSSSSRNSASASGVQTPVSTATSMTTHQKAEAHAREKAIVETHAQGKLTRTDSDEKTSSPSPPLVHSDTDPVYVRPRGLHRDESPPLLSTYDEPIRQVLEDMREQRMSLCQSLRQYVFVHRAIIEGALDILAEEQARVSSEGSGSGSGEEKVSGESAGEEGKLVGGGADRSEGESEGGDKAPPLPAIAVVTGKRGASPTELVKESELGGVVLHKRPSLRRKATADVPS